MKPLPSTHIKQRLHIYYLSEPKQVFALTVWLVGVAGTD